MTNRAALTLSQATVIIKAGAELMEPGQVSQWGLAQPFLRGGGDLERAGQAMRAGASIMTPAQLERWTQAAPYLDAELGEKPPAPSVVVPKEE